MMLLLSTLSIVPPPGHAAVDGKVDRVGEADEGVDDQHDVLRHLIVQEGVEAENRIIMKKTFMMIGT